MARQHIRYGIIGTGSMGVEHIGNISALDDASVVAIADPDPGSRKQGLSAVGADIAVYETHSELLDDHTVDAIVVATPNHTHIDVMTNVLASDKHVLCEKPLCTTTKDCLTVIELARCHAGVVQVGFRNVRAFEEAS